jgi:DNA-binding CsgD family transcriptional regulator
MLYLLTHSASCAGIAYFTKSARRIITMTSLVLTAVVMSIAPLLLLILPAHYLLLPAIPCLFPLLLTAASGMASAFHFVAWLEKFSQLSIIESATALSISLALSSILIVFSLFLPETAMIMTLLLMPAVSLNFIKKAQVSALLPGSITKPICSFFYPRLTFWLAAIYIVGGSMFKLLAIDNSLQYSFYISNLSYGIACIAAAWTLHKNTTPDLHIIFRPVLPLIGSGFLFFSIPNEIFRTIGFFILQAGFGCFDMYTWLLIALIARNHICPIAICAAGIACITGFIVCGDLFYSLMATITTFPLDMTVIYCISGIICLWGSHFYPVYPSAWQNMTTTFQPDINQFSSQEILCQKSNSSLPISEIPRDSLNEKNQDSLQQIPNCPIRLTPREQQVLILLIQGRDYRTISDRLGITINTVKFHIHHIYDKFGVKNRQELLTWLEQHDDYMQL